MAGSKNYEDKKAHFMKMGWVNVCVSCGGKATPCSRSLFNRRIGSFIHISCSNRLRKGEKRSEEFSKMLSILKKGKNRGPMNELWKKKISDSLVGKKKPPGFSDAVSRRMKGRIVSEEERRRISCRNTGRLHSEESKEKMRASQKLRIEKFGQHRQSEEAKDKCRRARLLQRFKRTSAEEKVGRVLSDLGISFEEQKPFDGRFVFDFFIADRCLAIEADGDYWHNGVGPAQRRNSMRRNDKILACLREGISMIELRESEGQEMMKAKIVEALKW